MPGTLGDIKGQITLDVKQALNAYTQTRLAHLNTVTALKTGGGAIAASGAAIAGVGVGIVGAFVASISKAAEFEKRLSAFGAVSDSTTKQMDAVRAKALELGKDTVYSANEIADSFVELGKQGRSASDIVNGLGKATANLASAGALPLATAGEILSNAMTTFGLSAQESVHAADQLAGAANASSVDVTDLGVSFKYVGGIAGALGLSFEDTTAALAELGNYGIKGSTAGTSLRQVLIALSGPTKKSAAGLKDLGIITADGANKFYDAQGKLKPMSAIIDTLGKALANKNLNPKERQDLLGQIFPVRSLPTIIDLLKGGTAGIDAMTAAIGRTTAAEVAGKRLDNLSGDIEILRGNVETLAIITGERFQSFARFIVQGATKIVAAFTNLPGAVQTAFVAFAGVGGLVLIAVGALGLMAGAILNIVALAIQLGPVMVAMGTALRSAAGGMYAFNAALASNPIVRIIAIIGALVAIFLVLYNTNEKFHAAVQPLFDALIGIFEQLAPIVTNVLGIFGQFLGQLAGQGATAGAGFLGTIGQLAQGLGGSLMSAIQTILPLIMQFINGALKVILPLLQPLIPVAVALAGAFAALFSGNVAGFATGIQDAIKGIAVFIQGIAGVIPQVVSVLTTLVTTIIGMLPTFIAGFLQLFTSALQALATALPQIVTGLITMLTGLITLIVSYLPMFITVFIQILLGLLSAIIQVLPQLILAVIDLVVAIINALVTAIPLIVTAITTALPVIISAITTALPLIITAALQLFMGIITALLQALPQIISALTSAMPQIGDAIGKAIPLILAVAVQLFFQLIVALALTLVKLIPAIIALVVAVIGAIISLVGALLSAAVQLFMGLMRAIGQVLPQVLAAIGQLVAQVVSSIANSASELFNAGVQFVQGLIGGIGSMVGDAVNAAVNLAKQVAGGVAKFLHIASPSRLLHSYGQFFTLGLANGITNKARVAVAAARNLAAMVAAVPFDSPALAGMSGTQNLTRSVAVQATASSTAQTNDKLDALNKKLDKIDIKSETTINTEINNPEPETASDSLPNALRKTAFLVG